MLNIALRNYATATPDLRSRYTNAPSSQVGAFNVKPPYGKYQLSGAGLYRQAFVLSAAFPSP